MAKTTYFMTPIGTLAYAHIEKPDTQAPKNATFKPDGKFKGTLVLASDEPSLDDLRDLCRKVLHDEFGQQAPTRDEDLNLPIKAGTKDDHVGKVLIEAKTQYRPAIYDANGDKVPNGIFARSGDRVRFYVSLYPFKKTEKVRENGRMVDVDLYGVSLRLGGIQIVQKGGGSRGFGAVEGGWTASPDDVPDNTGGADEAAEDTRQEGGRRPGNARDF